MFGKVENPKNEKLPDLSLREFATFAPLIVLAVWIGLYPKPFIDRFNIATGKTERLWQSAPPSYEEVLQVIDPDANRVITQRESPTDPPNVFVRDVKAIEKSVGGKHAKTGKDKGEP